MNRVIDVAEKLLIVLLAAPYLYAFAKVLPNHPNYVLVVASEILTIALVMTRRSGSVSLDPKVVLIAFLGTAAPLIARPEGIALLPSWITGPAMFVGLLLSVAAKLALNRSFGIVAANRGVKRGGPYRFVRHPMYLGYVITQLGFLLDSFSARNLIIYSLAWLMNWIRLVEEERHLMLDPQYQAFASKVRGRILPSWPHRDQGPPLADKAPPLA